MTVPLSPPLRIALYGTNGHQIQRLLVDHPHARLAAVAAFDPGKLPGDPSRIRVHTSLQGILDDPEIDVVSLCSPRRGDQAADAIACLRAGKHVYGEKPSALREQDLDAILAAAQRSGRQYREMAGTIVSPPYAVVRAAIASGAVGTVVQVLAQKSYPWADWRPQEEAIDGGLLLQVGVYPMRFVEHIAAARIRAVRAAKTTLGNPQQDGQGAMAVSFLMELEGGGVATAVCNYLNPISRIWGYEVLRIFGTGGLVEYDADQGRVRLARLGQAAVDLPVPATGPDYFDLYAQSLRGGAPMPLSMEEELSPTRWAIRARQQLG